MFCSAVIGALHCGQAERGVTRLIRPAGGRALALPASSAHSARSALSIMIGTRWITTLRKLPIIRPSTAQSR